MMNIISKAQMIDMAKKQLSIDLTCSPEQFDSYDNSIVNSKLMNGRRMFSLEKDFFRMATFGYGTVISIDEKLEDWCDENLKQHEGIRLFEHGMMNKIEIEMQKYGKHLCGVNEYYLPVPGFNRKKAGSSAVTVEYCFGEE